jgi:hypothetical protein
MRQQGIARTDFSHGRRQSDLGCAASHYLLRFVSLLRVIADPLSLGRKLLPITPASYEFWAILEPDGILARHSSEIDPGILLYTSVHKLL